MFPGTADLVGTSHCGGASRLEDTSAAAPPLPPPPQPPPQQQQEQQQQPLPPHGASLSSASSSALLSAPARSTLPPAVSDGPSTSQAWTTQQRQQQRHRHLHRLKEQHHDPRYQQQAPPLNLGQGNVNLGGFCSGVQRVWSEGGDAQQGDAYDVTNNHLPCRPQPPPYQEQHNHHHQHQHQQQEHQQQQQALAPSALRAVPGCHVLGQATCDNRGLSGVLATAATVLLWCVAAAAAAAEHQLDSAVRRGVALLDLYRRNREDERTAGLQDLPGLGRGLEPLGKVQDGRGAAAAAETTSAGKGEVVCTSPSASSATSCPDGYGESGGGGCGGCPAPTAMGPITATRSSLPSLPPAPMISSPEVRTAAHTARKGQTETQTERSCQSSIAVANASFRTGEQLAASAENAAVEAAAAHGPGGMAASYDPYGDDENSDRRANGDDGGGSTGSSSCCRQARGSSSLVGAERSSPALYRSPFTHAALSIKVTDVGEVAFEEACVSLQSAALRAIELLLGGAVDLAPEEAAAAAAAAAGTIAESRNSDREGAASECLVAVETREPSAQDAAFEGCGLRGNGGGSGGGGGARDCHDAHELCANVFRSAGAECGDGFKDDCPGGSGHGGDCEGAAGGGHISGTQYGVCSTTLGNDGAYGNRSENTEGSIIARGCIRGGDSVRAGVVPYQLRVLTLQGCIHLVIQVQVGQYAAAVGHGAAAAAAAAGPAAPAPRWFPASGTAPVTATGGTGAASWGPARQQAAGPGLSAQVQPTAGEWVDTAANPDGPLRTELVRHLMSILLPAISSAVEQWKMASRAAAIKERSGEGGESHTQPPAPLQLLQPPLNPSLQPEVSRLPTPSDLPSPTLAAPGLAAAASGTNLVARLADWLQPAAAGVAAATVAAAAGAVIDGAKGISDTHGTQPGPPQHQRLARVFAEPTDASPYFEPPTNHLISDEAGTSTHGTAVSREPVLQEMWTTLGSTTDITTRQPYGVGLAGGIVLAPSVAPVVSLRRLPLPPSARRSWGGSLADSVASLSYTWASDITAGTSHSVTSSIAAMTMMAAATSANGLGSGPGGSSMSTERPVLVSSLLSESSFDEVGVKDGGEFTAAPVAAAVPEAKAASEIGGRPSEPLLAFLEPPVIALLRAADTRPVVSECMMHVFRRRQWGQPLLPPRSPPPRHPQQGHSSEPPRAVRVVMHQRGQVMLDQEAQLWDSEQQHGEAEEQVIQPAPGVMPVVLEGKEVIGAARRLAEYYCCGTIRLGLEHLVEGPAFLLVLPLRPPSPSPSQAPSPGYASYNSKITCQEAFLLMPLLVVPEPVAAELTGLVDAMANAAEPAVMSAAAGGAEIDPRVTRALASREYLAPMLMDLAVMLENAGSAAVVAGSGAGSVTVQGGVSTTHVAEVLAPLAESGSSTAGGAGDRHVLTYNKIQPGQLQQLGAHVLRFLYDTGNGCLFATARLLAKNISPKFNARNLKISCISD